MIKHIEVSQALYNYLKANTALRIAVDLGQFTATPDEDYIREKNVTGETSIPVSLKGLDSANGFYQIDVCTPIYKHKWRCEKKRDDIAALFTKGLSAGIEHNGQKVSISNVNYTSPRRINDTHIACTLSIYYIVVG